VLVSGDGHLLDLAADLPIYPPAAFLAPVEDRAPLESAEGTPHDGP
jgi:hypothetical protein